jgi:ankyrin repeat protein
MKFLCQDLDDGLPKSLREGCRDWEQHKETIRNYYITRNFTLQRLRHEMSSTYGFDATYVSSNSLLMCSLLKDIRKAQYERKLTGWGFKKNRKKREWIEIAEKVFERQIGGKDSEVVIDDQVVPRKKLRKEFNRYGFDLGRNFSIRDQQRQCPSFNKVAYSSSAADDAKSSCVAIVRSPKARPAATYAIPSTTPPPIFAMNAPWVSVPNTRQTHFPVTLELPLSPLLIEASNFLRIPNSMTQVNLLASIKQVLQPSSSLNKSLQAAMVPSEYSKLMKIDLSCQTGLSAVDNQDIMSTAIFLFRNSLIESSFDLGHQLFTWFQANYDARVFKFLAGKKDPSALATLEKLFRQAVWEGDSEMVRELLLTGIDPNQHWQVPSTDIHFHTTPKSAILIACERKYLRIANSLLDSGASVGEAAPLCRLLEGSLPLDLDLVKKLITATPRKTLLDYPGCLISAIQRKDLALVEVLVEGGIDDWALHRFSCIQQNCSSSSSRGNALLDCPTHTITLPVLKKLVITRTRRCLRSVKLKTKHIADAQIIESALADFNRLLSEILDSLVHQRNEQGIEFLLQCGAYFTKNLLLFLCRTPDLGLISRLLSEAIISFHEGQEVPVQSSSKIISRFTSIISMNPLSGSRDSTDGTGIENSYRDPANNVSITRKIAEALTDLSVGTKSQCCEALLRNSLWRSLAPTDWPYYRDAFQAISRASGSDIDFSQDRLLMAVKTRDALGLLCLLDSEVSCSELALIDLLHEAASWGNAEIFKRLIHELSWVAPKASGLDKYGGEFIRNAIIDGNLSGVQELFSCGIGVDFALYAGFALAIEEGQKDIVHFLLHSGASPNLQFEDWDGQLTPLAEALKSGNLDLVKLLVRFGASPNNEDALCIASELTTPVLDTLLRACNKEFLTKGAVPVLHNAIVDLELETIKLLLKYNVDCNLLIGIDERKTCLAAAIETEDDEILRLIIDTGVNINGIVEQSSIGWRTGFPRSYTAIVKAIQCPNLSAVDILLEAGAAVNPIGGTCSPVGPTPLQAAVDQGNFELVQRLLDLGANADEIPLPYGGYTALQVAASEGLIGIASLLLKHGADVNRKGAIKGGRTALEAAAENDRIDMVRFLVQSGAQIVGPDGQQYWQARALALKVGHFAVCATLEALFDKQGGGQSSTQIVSLDDDCDFDYSIGLPPLDDIPDEPFRSTLGETMGNTNDFDYSIGLPDFDDITDEPFHSTLGETMGKMNDLDYSSGLPPFDDIPDEPFHSTLGETIGKMNDSAVEPSSLWSFEDFSFGTSFEDITGSNLGK